MTDNDELHGVWPKGGGDYIWQCMLSIQQNGAASVADQFDIGLTDSILVMGIDPTVGESLPPPPIKSPLKFLSLKQRFSAW